MRAGIAFPGDAQPRTVCAPAGMRTSTVSVRATRPSPPQVGQAFCSRPLPPQRGQVRLNFMAPAIW